MAVATVCLVACALGARAGEPEKTPVGLRMAMAGPWAEADVKPLGTNTVTGQVMFHVLANGVEVRGTFKGLTPGEHGFHIHEFGDCSAADGSSAGPHFNPGGHAHGGPATPESHAGDYGNLNADANGTASFVYVSKRITLDSSETTVVGRAVIVHEKQDDLSSQPAGNAGPRIGCGVILFKGKPTTPIVKK
jgi:Cu-Zn family superoxide dismutase